MTNDDDPVPAAASVRPVLASIDRESRARLLAALTRRFRDIDLAEDALQEALARALKIWPAEGIPRSPEAWLLTVAKRAAVDDLRREQTRDRSTPVLGAELTRAPVPAELRDPADRIAEAGRDPISDDRLGMLFACAHPALRVEDRIALTEQAAAMPEAGSYTVQAAIAALHAEAASFNDTDWAQIAVLYRMLETHEPGPLVRLGRAVALGRAHGPEVGLRRLEELADDAQLASHRAFHIARALTLEELGDTAGAAEAYRRALDIPGNEAEEVFLMAALAELQ